MPVSISQVDPESAELRAVISLHKEARETLGFLPDAGFGDRAQRGTLLAASLDGDVVGYVLYDLPGDVVRIRHLCVNRRSRGCGIARELVEAIKEHHSGYRAILLDCRRDYGLADMWSRLGFRPVGQRPGRSLKRHPLTTWEFDFGHPTLFSQVEVPRELACLDQMVLEDLRTHRLEGRHSRHLLEDWVEELVELCVTDEVLHESNYASEGTLRGRLLAAARSYRNLSRPGAPWASHVDRVRELVPRADQPDHRHLARAIEGGAAYFLTRDEKVLASASPLRDEFGIQTVAPDDLIDRLDRERRQDPYEPAALEGTELTIERLPAAQIDRFVAALLNHGDGEKAHELRSVLRAGFATPKESEVIVVTSADGSVLGGLVRHQEDRRLVVTSIRVPGASRVADAIARQLLFQQRAEAAARRLGAVVVCDRFVSTSIRKVLPSESYLLRDGGSEWECQVWRGTFEAGDVLEGELSPSGAAAFERSRWPAKVTGAGLPTLALSIEPSFAERLFDTDLAAATLFPRDSALGLSREQVYYRAPRPYRNLAGPARVLWYVKQSRHHPVGHVRAVSRLVEVVVDRPRTLHSRFARLGVWSREQVEEVARRTGEAMALRVADTEVFEQPVSLPDLRAMAQAAGDRFNAPQSPQPVSERMFCLVYREGSRYA